METTKNIFAQFSLPWIMFTVASVFCVIVFIAICVCWQGRKKHIQSYIMKSDDISQAELPTNMMPHIIMDQKQKYFLHGVKYSSINNSDEVNDHFSYNILSIFRNIQKNKFANNNGDMAKMLPDTLEDSHTDSMHKNFDKSVLCLQWNETPTDSNSRTDKDEVYSCISADSKETFASVLPHYNRSHSVAETFKSINSEN